MMSKKADIKGIDLNFDDEISLGNLPEHVIGD
jgi:signal transduction histidine kinase